MKEQIESIIQYELASLAVGVSYPIAKVVKHFGEETICKAYGCTKSSMALARELVSIVFNEFDKVGE